MKMRDQIQFFHFSFPGDVCICHVIFGTVGISNQMAPPIAVEKIPNLLISKKMACSHLGKCYKHIKKNKVKHTVS